jgi:hypothetical protein
MQLETTFRYLLTPVRMAIFKGSTTTYAGENAMKQEPLHFEGMQLE